MEFTVINEKNRSYFEPFMAESLWQETDLALGAMEDGKACGLLAAREEDTVYRILTITSQKEGVEVQKGLLEALDQVVETMRMDVCVFSALGAEISENLVEALEDLGYEKDGESSPVYEVAFSDLSDKLFAKKSGNEKTISLAMASSRDWAEFSRKAQAQMEELDLCDLEAKSAYDQECSFLLRDQDQVNGGILFRKVGDDYVLAYLCVFGKVAPTDMMALFQASFGAFGKRDMEKAKIYINAVTETTRQMVLKMTEQKAKLVGEAADWVKVY